MTSVLRDLRELAKAAIEGHFQTQIETGDVFWVPNRVLENEVFRFKEGFLHPVVVVEIMESEVEVRVMTSKVSNNRRNGFPYGPGAGVRLDGEGLILTRNRFHRRLPITALKQRHYLGNVGLGTLLMIWVSEWAMDSGEPPLQVNGEQPFYQTSIQNRLAA